MHYYIRLINITPELAQDKEFESKFSLIQKQLNTPGKIDFTCLHEAGHLVYFERAGIDAHIFGPTIEYVEREREFVTCLSTIGTPTINEYTPYTLELYADLANAGVAGTLFGDDFLKDFDPDSPLAQQIRAERDTILHNDWLVFDQCCRWGIQRVPIAASRKCWPTAMASVTADLTNQKTREDIHLKAKEIRAKCFREIMLPT